MTVEYGGSANWRFAKPKVIDSEGNEMLCKCGKPISGGIFGKEAFQAWCEECDPNPIPKEHRFVYIPPSGSGKPQICDGWVMKSSLMAEDDPR